MRTGKILYGSALVSLGQVIGFGASFLRNVILGRTLEKADFGIAACFATTIAALELAGKMSIRQQVVQAKDGESGRFRAAAHLCQFLVSLVSACILVALGKPIADAFGVPQAGWAFASLGLIALMRGLENFDVAGQTRELEFKRSVLADTIPQVLMTLLAYPLAVWLGDYRVVVYLILGRELVRAALSHVFARTSYRWLWDPALFRRIFAFGGPFVLNGMLMFGHQQGDLVLVGANYSVLDLALYAVAGSMTVVPGYMFIQVMMSIMLPILSKAQDDIGRFTRHYSICNEASAFAGVMVSCFLITSGELLVVLVFGEKYRNAGPIIAWLSCMNMLRITRSAPSLAAIARGDTIINLNANIARLTGLALAAVAAVKGLNIYWLAAAGVVGEIAALATSYAQLAKRHQIPLAASLEPGFLSAFVIAIPAAFFATGIQTRPWYYVVAATILSTVVPGWIMWRRLKGFRQYSLRALAGSGTGRRFIPMASWLGGSPE